MQEGNPILHVSLLGTFQLIWGETPVRGVDLSRMQSLLAYLLMHNGVPQSRTHLAFLFWPDSTDSQALTNLRNIVHKLRQALPNADRFLHIERQTLVWNPGPLGIQGSPWTFDVFDFEKTIAQAEQTREVTTERQVLERGVKLYRGDLLPGCYDDWILPERDRLHQLFIRALERLVELQEQQRHYDAAINSAQQLLRYDPLHEATYRHLMSLYAASGDRAAALRTYHTCSTVLERELGTEPGKATRDIYERLLQSEGIPTEQRSLTPKFMAAAPLVGRQREWAQLLSDWRNASSGRPHCFLLAGEAGIGKTRLAEELLSWAGRQGVVTAIARCYVTEGGLAYAPIVSWLRSDDLRAGLSSLADIWLTEVARLLPDLLEEKPGLSHPGPITEGWQRQRFFEALALAILKRNQPLLLLLDDVQWCDYETLEWLHYLLHFDPKAPLLLICTARFEEMAERHALETLLGSLRRDRLLTEVALEPLSASETAYLAAHLSGEDLDPVVTTALFQETEGNPLFVVETVRAGAVEKVRTGQLSLEGARARAGALLPPTVQAVISSRLALLSSAAQEVMGLAAVIGRAFTFQVLMRASNMDEDLLVRGLDELWQRRIVREQGGDAYDFSHDKLREQAYASLSMARRRMLHRRVGDALVALNGSDEIALDSLSGQIADHYERAGVIEQAITYYVRVAEKEQRIYANTEAFTCYKHALNLLERIPDSDTKREWRQEIAVRCEESIGDILSLKGEFEAARDSYQRALAWVKERKHIRRAGLHRKIAKTWELQLRYEDALRAYSMAESALGSEAQESAGEWWQEWLELQDRKIDIYGMLWRMDEVAETLEQMRPIVQQYGTPMQRAEFFFSSALTSSRLKRFMVSAEDLAEAHAGLSAYEAIGDPLKIGWGNLSLAYLYLSENNLEKAEEHVCEALKLAERTGDAMMQMRALSILALVCRKRGQREEVRRAILLAQPLAEAMGQPVSIGLNKANLAWLAWQEGNYLEAQALGRAALVEWRSHPVAYYYWQWTALLPLIDIALAEDSLAEAIEHVRELLSPRQQLLPDLLTIAIEAAIQAWDAGQQDNARTCIRELISASRETGYL